MRDGLNIETLQPVRRERGGRISQSFFGAVRRARTFETLFAVKLYLSRHALRRAVLSFSVILIVFFLLIRLAFSGTYQKLIQEDSFIEYSQSIAFMLSSILGFSIMVRFFRSGLTFHGILYLAFSLAMIFVSLEEVSWGQRLFYLPLPDYFKEHNVQGELTLHNLDMVQPRLLKLYILTGAFGSFAWLLVTKNVKKYRRDVVAYLIPDWYLMFYFLPVFIVYIYFDMISWIGVYWFNLEWMRVGYFVIWRDQEPAELLLSLGFLIFAVKNRLRLSLTFAEQDGRIESTQK